MYNLTNKKVKLSYKGPFSIQALSLFGNYIKSFQIENPISKTKLFKVFLELSQNVSYYSADKCDLEENPSTGIGIFTLKENDDHFVITTRNKIRKVDAHTLVSNCSQINEMNFAELKALKSYKMKNRKEYENSAHVGLIQLLLLSQNKLTYHFDHEEEYFELSVKINKNYDKELKNSVSDE